MKIKVLFFAALFSFFSCGSGEDNGNERTQAESTKPVEKPLERFRYDGVVTIGIIDSLVTLVYDEEAKRIDPPKAKQFIAACEKYATENKDDPKSPEWLLKAAETARNINAKRYAIALYDDVMTKFPNYPKVSQALFLKAFTLDDNMNRKEEAKQLYSEFIQKYPNDDFIESAKFMLENIDKTDAEIIKEFENNRQEQ